MVEVSGGDKADVALAKLGERLARGHAVRVGFLEGATHINPDGTTTPTAYIAALNNYGHGGTPPRPFFSNMVSNESGGWGDALEAAMEYAGNDTAAALAILGEHIAGQLRESIVDTYAPALSPVTVMLRHMRAKDPDLVVTGRTVGEAAARVARGESTGDASTKPLVDSGQMLGAVDYEVET